MWEHCGHFSSCAQGPQLNNEEKIAMSWAGTMQLPVWPVGGAPWLPGSHEAVIMLSLAACQGILIHIFSLQRREPEQLQDNVITLVTPG